MKISERDQKEASPKVHPQIREEKKKFLKTQIKARQLKRIYMVILSGKVIPTDIDEFNQLELLYNNATKDEIGHQVSKIAAGRLKQ